MSLTRLVALLSHNGIVTSNVRFCGPATKSCRSGHDNVVAIPVSLLAAASRRAANYALVVAIALEEVLKVVFNWLPMPLIAVIEATAISAAIRPYSMAVAP